MALADWGLSRGALIHPLSREPLNSCEVLRLEHQLVAAGRSSYAGLAAQLREAVAQPQEHQERGGEAAARPAGQDGTFDLSCLDHSYFLAEVAQLLSQAERHQRQLSLRDGRGADLKSGTKFWLKFREI